MSKKVALPLLFLSLGIFAVTQTVGCGGGNGGSGTGGKADGGTDAAKGTGGTIGGTGGRADSGTDAVVGTGGRADSGTDVVVGTGGRADSGTDVVVGTGGRIDSGTDVAGTGGADAATDTPTDMATADAPADVPPGTDAPVIFDGSTAFDGAADASGLTRAAVLCPSFPNTSTSAAQGSMEPADFCAIFVQICGGTVDAGDCITRYTASRTTGMATYGTVGTCESAHVCNAYNGIGPTDGGSLVTHCPHAAGTVLCVP